MLLTVLVLRRSVLTTYGIRVIRATSRKTEILHVCCLVPRPSPQLFSLAVIKAVEGLGTKIVSAKCLKMQSAKIVRLENLDVYGILTRMTSQVERLQ